MCFFENDPNTKDVYSAWEMWIFFLNKKNLTGTLISKNKLLSSNNYFENLLTTQNRKHSKCSLWMLLNIYC